MIRATLNENFDYICVVDTEFKGQQDEGQLNDPVCKIGRAHVRTPVTSLSRMPSSA